MQQVDLPVVFAADRDLIHTIDYETYREVGWGSPENACEIFNSEALPTAVSDSAFTTHSVPLYE
jgi:hypothetical protein